MLDPPRTLPPTATGQPLPHLSLSSIQTFLRCPEKWRRRYIDGEPDFVGGAAIIGKAVGAAESESYQQKIDSGEDLPEADVLDRYSDEFDFHAERDQVEWGEDKPGVLKDQGARVLPVYHRLIAPTVRPKAVERQAWVPFEDVDWGFQAYLDVEEEDDTVLDLKVKARAISQLDADADLQPSAYLMVKRAEAPDLLIDIEDDGAHLRDHDYAIPGFRFHPLVRVKSPEPKHVQPVATMRSDEQLDSFLGLIFRVAAEMHWRYENDVWAGAAPGSWWCSEKWCSFWHDCEFGGKLRVATTGEAVPA